MAEYKISVDLSAVSAAARAAVNEQVFPLLNQAVRAVAQQTQINWMEAVQRARLWSVEKDAYSGSISMKMTGPFAAEVWSDYKHAEAIETGRPPYDLKQMLNTSPKVRRTKDGRRFLVIPFRHNTPGNEAHAPAMPQHVYDAASMLASSRIVGQGQRPAGEVTSLHPRWGMRALKKQTPFLSSRATKATYMVPKFQYQWGGKLGAGSMGPNPKGKVDRYAGMYRFDTSTPGGGRHSTFMTFRVMMEGQTGWIIPARPGLYLAKKVSEDMQPLAERAFGEAITRTLG